MCLVFSGTILKEDDGLIEPIDLAVLLLTSYLDTLDPELFPEEDRPGLLTLCHSVELLSDEHVQLNVGAQWLSGRVLDSRTRGRRFEHHRRHCVCVLEQYTFILALLFNPGRPVPTQLKTADWDVKNQIKQNRTIKCNE